MKWKKYSIQIALIAFSAVTGCLAVLPTIAVSAEPQKSNKLAAIESIAPTGDGSSTQLSIKLTSPSTYTSYKTSSPLRLVVDLSQVTQGNVSAPVVINQGNFKTVKTSRFDTDAGVLTRIEIELVADSEALILAPAATSGGELRVSFPSLAGNEASAAKNNSAPVPVVSEPAKSAQESVPVVANSTSMATLTAISVSDNTILFALEGAASDFNTFRLNKPERYVVDLMNVKSGLSAKLLPLNASGVASARIGIYPDKVRIVLDAINGNFPEATAVKTAAGVVVTLDAKSVSAKPVDENANTKLVATRVFKPVVPEAKAEVKPEVKTAVKPEAVKQVVLEKPVTKTAKSAAGPSVIEMIDFQVIENISRVSVKVTGEVNVEEPAKSPGFVTLTIKNSTLPKNLQRSLETASFVSPILRVTPLTVKSKKGSDTKIRISTRVSGPFDFKREADMIYIDFKHPEGMAGDKLVVTKTDKVEKAPLQKPVTAVEEEVAQPEITQAADTTAKPSGSAQVFKGRKVTLEFADAEVRKIFQLLSEVSGKNFVLSDDVSGNISLKLVNVPWDQALSIILDTKDLDSREAGNVLTIKKKGKFKSAMDEELENKKVAAKSIELVSDTFAVNYASIDDIAGQFEKIKTPDRGAQISPDKRTNKVFVKDTPQAIAEMRKLLAQMDVPERQVMIEARIVEATSTFTRSLGVNWGMHYRDGTAALAGINLMDTSFGGMTNAAPTSGQSSQAGGSMGISFGKLASNISIDMRLNAAASAGMIKIISSPKVATLNHKAAKISQGQQIPYQNTTATTGAVTAFVAATLSLEVTPHINANGTIVMKIDAKNDAPGTGSPPPINTKQATTELLLKDGETTVIGGIFVDSESDSDEGVPYLMDIPFLGNLFKSNLKSKTKTELLIFVTPRILSGV